MATSRPSLGQVLVTAYFWLAFAVTCGVGLIGGLVVSLISLPFDPDRRWVHAFICRWTFDYLKLNPLWNVEILHRERLPRGACVLVANHQSMADVVAVMGLFHPFKFVSKASLFSLPVVGWLMRLARYVALDRGRRKSMQRMLETCTQWLHRGMSVLMFPEGTYSPDGKLLPFRRGAFSLAMVAQVPLVPIVMEGTPDLVYDDGPWMNVRATVRLTVLEPLSPDSYGTDVTALATRVRTRMAEALHQSTEPVPVVEES